MRVWGQILPPPVKIAEKAENIIIQRGSDSIGQLGLGLHLCCHSRLQMWHCPVSDAQSLIPPAHANLLCAEGNIKFTVHQAYPTTRHLFWSNLLVEHKGLRVGAGHYRNGSVCRKFSPNSKSYKYIHIIKKKKKREICSQQLKTKNRDTWVTKTGTCLCLTIYFW